MRKIPSSQLLNDENDTKNVAILLAEQIKNGDIKKGTIFLLEGDLGSGKSTFVKYLIQHLAGLLITVPSPTFTLMQKYILIPLSIWHFDLYRLKSEHELEELGLDEAWNEGISFIEWPQRMGCYYPKKFIHINFKITEGENDITSRHMTIKETAH